MIEIDPTLFGALLSIAVLVGATIGAFLQWLFHREDCVRSKRLLTDQLEQHREYHSDFMERYSELQMKYAETVIKLAKTENKYVEIAS